MTETTHLSAHSAEEEHIHLPEPTIWPFILAIGVGIAPIGILLWAYDHPLGVGVSAGAGVLILLSGLAWATSVIREKYEVDIEWGNRSLSMAWKLFLLSEAAIFGAFFAHYYYLLYHWEWGETAWPPSGTPHIHLIVPAVGTIVLVTSSITCELGHKALLAGRKSLSKTWIATTIVLGFAFLSLQAYEWGYLLAGYDFSVSTNVVGTVFYLITGFHGVHVITGLLLLFLVYSRLEMGAFDRKRHFSMNAASWYWHFVDVIWFVVFLTLYIRLQPLE